MKKNVPDSLLNWIEQAKKAMEENTKKEFPTSDINWQRLGTDFGPSYIRVWVDSLKFPESRKSAYCFLDYEGNIYKAAGWKSPAKGIRATIETKNPSTLSSSTFWLYR